MPARASERPSILQIAQQAGVSSATVSRAFSRPELVHAETLARIQAVARRAGFRPNRIGRSLRSGSTRTIGLILPTLSNPVFAECFEGAERYARESGYSIMLTVTNYDPARESKAVRDLLDHQVEGLLLTVTDAARSKVLASLRDTGRPYVLLYNESIHHPYVSVDNRAAARDMLDHLYALGHRRVAIVTGPLIASDRARLRLQAARVRAAELGMAAIAHWVMPSHIHADARPLATGHREAFILEDTLGRSDIHGAPKVPLYCGGQTQAARSRFFRTALTAPEAPTALFCSNDRLAASLIACLARARIGVPRDVSVCGFDGIEINALFTPALTSVQQPSREIGKRACQLLLTRIQKDSEPRSLSLPHRLLPGGTVAAPPHRDVLFTTRGTHRHAYRPD